MDLIEIRGINWIEMNNNNFHHYVIMILLSILRDFKRPLIGKSGTVKLRPCGYLLDAVGSSGILKGKQKLGVTFNSDKLGGIDFTKFSKLTMCSA